MCYTIRICSERGCGHNFPVPTPCSDHEKYDPYCRKGKGPYQIRQEEFWCQECFSAYLNLGLLPLKHEQDWREARQRVRAAVGRDQTEDEEVAVLVGNEASSDILIDGPTAEAITPRQAANVGVPLADLARKFRNDEDTIGQGERSSGFEQSFSYGVAQLATETQWKWGRDVPQQSKKQYEVQATVAPPAGWWQPASWLPFWG